MEEESKAIFPIYIRIEISVENYELSLFADGEFPKLYFWWSYYVFEFQGMIWKAIGLDAIQHISKQQIIQIGLISFDFHSSWVYTLW